jgi:hypothetical protein
MMAVMFDWNDLRHLIAVSRHGSTLAAAKALGVNQSTVYRRLSACRIAVPARVDLKFHGTTPVSDNRRRVGARESATEIPARIKYSGFGSRLDHHITSAFS